MQEVLSYLNTDIASLPGLSLHNIPRAEDPLQALRLSEQLIADITQRRAAFNLPGL